MTWHAFARKTSNNTIWDATLMYDTDADPDNVTGSDPECGAVSDSTTFSFVLPMHVSQNTFIDNLLDDWAKEELADNTPVFDDHSFDIAEP